MNRYAKYRALVALAETQNFSRAAARLGLSQPALTRSIQALESAVGGELVRRGGRQIEMTELGVHLLERARRILDQVQELDTDLRALAALETGQLRFGAGPFPTVVLVPDVLATMVKRHPNLELAFEMEGWHLITQRVKERRLDLVVTYSVDAERDHELQVARLKPRRMILVAREDHPLAGRGTLSPSQLKDFPFATSSLPPKVEKILRGTLGADWHPTLSCDDVRMLVEYVRMTDALTFMPEIIVGQQPGLRRLPYSEPIPDTQWGIIRPADRTLSPAAQVLMETIKAIDKSLD